MRDVFPRWRASDRVVIVAADPVSDLKLSGGLVLALTAAFYARPETREASYFGYPSHFVVGGEPGAQPRLLRPGESRPWGAGWCWIDVWPGTHHMVADPSAASLLRAVLMLEPTVVMWPQRLRWPRHAFAQLAGLAEDAAWLLLRSHLRQLITYQISPLAESTGQSWSLDLAGRSAQLLQEAVNRLDGAVVGPERASRWQGHFTTLPERCLPSG